ncbi:MAG TPA: ATP-binding protein [Blastocatellia bacterium]|nr:ATP-binding protein [Blastocatellia bacterium]
MPEPVSSNSAPLSRSPQRHLARVVRQRKRKLPHDLRIFFLTLLAGLPGVAVALYLLWFGDYSTKVQWTLTLLVVGFWLGLAAAVRERVVRPLQTVSNLLAALHEEDFSVRARGAGVDDALGELFIEVNSLSETLREQKLGALEATALLRAVMSEIDVAVFTFDGEHKLRLVNRAGEKLLARPAERLIGQSAEQLGLSDSLEVPGFQTRQLRFPGGSGKFGVRHGSFRQRGDAHDLLVITDLSLALREEERQAWQRIVRVLGHELNNSLTPIKSIAGSLAMIFNRTPRPDDWEADVQRGLDVIASRAESLNRFMSAYAKLAKLPQPTMRPLEVGALLRRVVELETRMSVTLVPGPDLTIRADGDQLEQLLINVIRNAVDAVLEHGGGEVKVGWTHPAQLEITIEDDGPGLSGTTNLFVPFFTTKPTGSGIGLVLSRNIAEAHGGSLTLENKSSGHGCIARLRLPI